MANNRNYLADFSRMKVFKRTLVHHEMLDRLGKSTWKTRGIKEGLAAGTTVHVSPGNPADIKRFLCFRWC